MHKIATIMHTVPSIKKAICRKDNGTSIVQSEMAVKSVSFTISYIVNTY